MSQVGRISGPLLFANLERNGIDLAFETDLIYLDVTGNKIGIRNASPSNEIQISDTTRTVSLIADTQADIANLNIQSSTIQPFPGSLILDARYTITANRIKTDNLLLDDDRISTYTTDTNIEFRPNQTGATEFNNLWVENNLNVTGDVRLDGDITFGNADTDSVTFDADVTSNIIPDADATYNLGISSKRWQTIEANLLNGQDIDAQVALIGNVNIGTRPGNLYYVSTNGNNSNTGDHPQGPFLTIDHAVTQATAGDTILVFPGEYEETCPIEVPAGVAIRGTNMRNVIVKPVSSDNYVDIFLLNGESTVTDLTVKDFYYNSSNDTGYAFRFANNATITTRSPYIQNVTVITKGSVTSADDPRGFAEGDAGKGALVDGASVLNTSKEASMLFHAATFITPGVDAITMTNGVRVEWLNSFTYFANRGLYAVNGSTGHLSTDGVTVKYGAELRSIGSACVYGSYGAVADGSDTLMYLIQHNMGYIGVGKYVDNDPSRAIQTNEIIKLNSGQIYYQTVNHFGDFRIGDNFFVNQETGESNIVITQGEVQGFGRLRVTATASGNVTIIDGEQITTGNLLFTGNRISSVLGNVDIASAGVINLSDDTNILGNLSISGDLTFDGSLNLLGNEATDTLTFNVDIDQDLTPNTTLSFDLGSSSKEWNNVWLSEAQIGDLQIRDNYITTDISSADLELRANGAGEILIPVNNVQVDNNLTVSDATDLQDLSITGLLDQSGNRTQTGDVTLNGELTVDNVYIEDNFITTTTGDLTLASTNEVHVDSNDVEITQDLTVSAATNLQSLEITGLLVQTGDRNQTGDYSVTNLTITGDLDTGSQQQFEEILFDGNVVSTTTTSADLELRASGTGEVLVPNNNVQIDNNLEVQGTTFTQDVNNSQTVEAVTITTSDVNITGNVIDTSTSNNDLELRADQYSKIVISDNAIFENNLTVSGITDLQSTNVTGTLTHVGDTTQTGDRTQTNMTVNGEVTFDRRVDFEDVQISGNVITTTNSQSDLELRASGTGEILIPNNNVQLNNDLFVANINTGDINVNNDLVLDELVITDSNIEINENYITTDTSHSNLELRANNVGKVLIPNNDITAEQDLAVNGTIDINELSVNGSITQTGDVNQTGDLDIIGDFILDGDFTISDQPFQFEDIRVDGNVITTTATNANLDLRANGTGSIHVNDSAQIINNLTVRDITATDIILDNSFALENLVSSTDIEIFDNVITTTNSSSNLELRSNGTGYVYLQELGFEQDTLSTVDTAIKLAVRNLDIEATGSLKIPVGTTVDRIDSIPEQIIDGGDADDILLTVYDGGDAGTVFTAGDLFLDAETAFTTEGNPGDIRFNTDVGLFEGYSTTHQFFGGVYSEDVGTSIYTDTNNQIVLNVNNVQVGVVDSDSFTINGLQVDDIIIDNTLISTNVSDSDLELIPSGTGRIKKDDLEFKDNIFYNLSTGGLMLASTDNGYYKISGTNGIVIPQGTDADRGLNPQTGEIRWNTTQGIKEVYNGTEWIPVRGTIDNVTAAEFGIILDEYVLIFG